MSLGSLVANLFSWTSSSEAAGRLGVDDAEGIRKLQIAHVRPTSNTGMGRKDEAQVTSEIERRAPYLHVSPLVFHTRSRS